MAISISLSLPILSIDVLILNDYLSNHLPGNITKLEWMGDSILILDSRKDPGLYLYDSEGTLVNSYSREIGRASCRERV